MSIVAVEIVEIDLELVEGDAIVLLLAEVVVVSEVRVEADAAAVVVKERELALLLVLVRIVDVDAEHAARVVDALAAQVLRQLARHVDEATELIEVRGERAVPSSLEVAHEQPIDLGQVAHVAHLTLAVEYEAEGEVLIGRIDHLDLVLVVLRRVRRRVEVAVERVEDEIDGEVAQVVAHAEVEVEVAVAFGARVEAAEIALDGRWSTSVFTVVIVVVVVFFVVLGRCTLRLNVEQCIEAALVVDVSQVEVGDELDGVSFGGYFAHIARYDELVGAIDRYVLVRVQIVHVALVVAEHLERHRELPVDLVERVEVVVRMLRLTLLPLDEVRKRLELIDVHELRMLGEKLGILLSVRKGVVAQRHFAVAEQLVQLDPVHEHVVVVEHVRFAVEIAVGAHLYKIKKR